MPLTIHIFGPCSYPFEPVVLEIPQSTRPRFRVNQRPAITNPAGTVTLTRLPRAQARAPPHRWGPGPVAVNTRPPVTLAAGRVRTTAPPTPNGPPARS